MSQSLDLQNLDAAARQVVQELLERIEQQTALAQQQAIVLERQAGELKHKTVLLDKLTYEMAVLKRLKFAAKTEALNAGQASLLQESLEEDLQAVGEEIEQLRTPAERAQRRQPKRLPLPEHLPRQEFIHEPESTECCGQPMTRMGEEASEKLDYQPGVRSGSACLNSFTPRDKETAGDWDGCRVVHGGGRRLRRTGRRGGQLGEHQGFSFYAAACIDGSIAQ
jgi:hypothetical protein